MTSTVPAATAAPPRSARVATAARTTGALLLLAAALPLNLLVTVPALVLTARAPVRSPGGRTVMISGGKMTKALQLARSFARAGHRVVLVETEHYRFTGHRFSNAVDAFRVVPAPADPDYAAALLEVVREEAVDVYVPVCSPVASRFDALAKSVLEPACEVMHVGPDVVDRLDDKDLFALAAQELGLPVPETHRIEHPQEVLDFEFPPGRQYVLKSIAYDPIRRLDLTRLPRPTAAETAEFVAGLPISPSNPWILQEFVTGTEYCTHSTVRAGRVRLHCCCESSAFQLNYAHVDKPEIEAWVRRFVAGLGLTGQVSFDFIETDDGRQVAIECNPRTHSAITMFYDHPGVADAYLEPGDTTITPTPSSRATHWTYHEVWQAVLRPASIPLRAVRLLTGKDAIFDRRDPMPFLAEHHLQIPLLLLGNLRRLKPWRRIDFNIGKLVEPAGD
ncbi:hypothetical protein [Amnibacterium kyonggiense]